MDIVLELVDTFIADDVYAYLFPIGNLNKTDINASTQITELWIWQPTTEYFYVQPSQAAYMSSLVRDNPYRQFPTIFFTTWFLACTTYFITATFSYCLLFDKRYLNHPRFIKNQIWIEIRMANMSMPFMAILMTPWLLLEIRGFTKLYDTIKDGPGWWYSILHIALFVLCTDFWNYWTHRLSHHPRVYKHFLCNHKLHHRFFIPTPYAGYAIHPVEGFALAIPYFIFPFILPLQKFVRIALYVVALLWPIAIHDGEFLTNNRIVNGTACHSLHHMHLNCNFGQYFTLCDRLFGTYRGPKNWMFQDEPWMSNKQKTIVGKDSSEENNENNNNNDQDNEQTDGKYQTNKKSE